MTKGTGDLRHKQADIWWTKHESACVGMVEMTGRVKDALGIALYLNRYEGRRDGRVPYAVMPTDATGAIIWQQDPIAKGTGRSVREADKLGMQALLRAANSGLVRPGR